MAPCKQPKSFHSLTYEAIARLVLDTCISFETVLGNYDSLPCRLAIAKLQDALLDQVPPVLWDSICESVLSHVWYFRLKDVRIVYATLIHKSVKKLAIQGLGQFRQEHIPFWKQQIGKLVNVVELDLQNVFCRDILLAVGSSCSKLEHICLSPCTSPAVLSSLIQCKQLKTVKSSHAFRSKQDVLFGVNLLPDLEYYEYDRMGELLANLEQAHPLKLTYLRELDATPRHIISAVNLCPHLRHLDISPLSRDDCSAIFDTLATSQLQISTLTIRRYFPFDERTLRFLFRKGQHIESLRVVKCKNSVNCTWVRYIGLCCKKLANLEISVLGILLPEEEIDHKDLIDHGAALENSANQERLSMNQELFTVPELPFGKLRTFKLEDVFGDRFWDSRIVTICLSNAISIESISLSGMIDEQPTDEELFALFDAKKMTLLAHLDLRGNLAMSERVLRHLYASCPSLKKMALWCKLDQLAANYLRSVLLNAKENNLDFNVEFKV